MLSRINNNSSLKSSLSCYIYLAICNREFYFLKNSVSGPGLLEIQISDYIRMSREWYLANVGVSQVFGMIGGLQRPSWCGAIQETAAVTWEVGKKPDFWTDLLSGHSVVRWPSKVGGLKSELAKQWEKLLRDQPAANSVSLISWMAAQEFQLQDGPGWRVNFLRMRLVVKLYAGCDASDSLMVRTTQVC